MGVMACAPLYFALPRSHLQPADKRWVFIKLVAVFVITQIILQMMFKTQDVQSSDPWTNVAGPMVAAYLAGKVFFTRVSP